ncbi:hypothetical protein EPO17_02395 [Patescibacteria group bacterium]|nr:MAG: hypothetical protein EPO17_02395 [Patescibacteria group bacterium]
MVSMKKIVKNKAIKPKSKKIASKPKGIKKVVKKEKEKKSGKKQAPKSVSVKKLLSFLNTQYVKLHREYENYFWLSYMGDGTVTKAMNEALARRDAFRANVNLYKNVCEVYRKAKGTNKKKLASWKLFFEKFQTPAELLTLKNTIAELESKIRTFHATQKEGYTDPATGKFVEASSVKMRTIMRTNPNEALRKACFEAVEKLAYGTLEDYIAVIALRNQYARGLGFEDFYAYKISTDEGMTKAELFALFGDIYEKTKYAFADIRKMEEKMPGLRKPWNFGYMISGDFTKEEDPYFQFDDALLRWGRSFSALGIDYRGGTLTLDLLDRKGKWNNGFCHWPEIVHYKRGKRIPASSNFTCNVVFGQVGSGSQGLNTLFHEGGHAADRLNSDQSECCLNTEYPPCSTAWAETHSMFLDTLSSSIEWKTRYAKNAEGKAYPFELYERKVRKIHPLIATDLMGIIFVSDYEREIYETVDLTADKVLEIAKRMYTKYFDRSEDSLYALNIPHIYSSDSSGAYHGYGLAELSLSQWREYFYKKYGYIVDNKEVGKEMTKVWKLGSSKTFKEFVKIATGKPLTADAYIRSVTKSLSDMLLDAQRKIKIMEQVPEYTKPVKLNAKIQMVHGKKLICDSKKSFEDMVEKYGKWLRTQKER